MASTAAGARLTQQHRQAQLALRARTLRQVLAVWPAFDINSIDASWNRLEPLLIEITAINREVSAGLSAAYYTGFRAAEGIPGAAPMGEVTPSPAWREAAVNSYRVTGPAAAQSLIARRHPDVRGQALVRLSGAVSRHVLDGGRETIEGAIRAERRRVGYARVTSGEPCAFCSMLASRGAVYSEQSGRFQSHDHCQCSLEPVFRDSAIPSRARELQRQWDDVTRGTQGQESIRTWRRHWEGRA